MVNINKLKKSMKKKRPKNTAIPSKDFFSLGFTPLNLAVTGHPDRGFAKGLYMLIVGDSSSGKTWIATQIEAEIANNPNFDEYQIVHDNAENGRLMPIRKYFGRKLASRMKPPRGTMEEPQNSATLEQFYDNLNDALDRGPCIYVLDSMDTLITADEKRADRANRTAREKGKEEKGTYGVTKAKMNSAKLRVATNRLQETGSILIIICQTRQTIGFLSKFEPRTRAGGDSLRFYNRFEMWLSRKERIKQKVGLKNIQIGQITKAKVVKNHVSGWEGDVDIPIYRGVGVDEIGGCIDFMVDWGFWPESAKVINAKELGVKKKREALASYVEDNDLHGKLKEIVTKAWEDIQAKVNITRKSRYE